MLILGCGAYDYILKMWSIWTFIILRYKNGMYFLSSHGLNENDFVGLIDREDTFLDGATVFKRGSSDDTQYEIIDKTDFPFFKIRQKSKDTLFEPETVYINKLIQAPLSDNDKNTKFNSTWDDMFDKNVDVIDNNNATKERIIKLENVKYNLDLKKYQMNGINLDFIKTIGNVPFGGLLSPFDEIKKYSSWYWGSDRAAKPRFVIEKEKQNNVCNTCINSQLCDPSNSTGGIKIKFTNSYKLIADLEKWGEESDADKNITPFTPLTSNMFNIFDSDGNKSSGSVNNNKLDFTIFRPQVIIDKSEPHTYFEKYKPVGDIY
jgi:hypothetical protein